MADCVLVALDVSDGVMEEVAVPEALGVTVPLRVPEVLAVGLELGVRVWLRLCDCVCVPVRERLVVTLALDDPVGL